MKKLITSLIIFSFVLFLVACSENEESGAGSDSSDLQFATATNGSTGYMYGVAVSNVVNSHSDRVGLTPISSAGVIENDRLLRDDSVDLIIHTGENAALSYAGEEPFDSSYELRALWPMYASFLNIVVMESSDIESISDLEGKRIGMGEPGSSAAIMTTSLMEVYGLTEDDYRSMPLGLDDQVSALQDGSIDAITTIASYDTPSFVELVNARDVRWVSIDDDAREELIESALPGSFIPITMPAGSYDGQDTDFETLGAPLWVMANEDFETEVTSEIIDVFFDNLDEAINMHAVVEQTNQELVETSIPPAPWHEGAEQVFEELGYEVTPYEE